MTIIQILICYFFSVRKSVSAKKSSPMVSSTTKSGKPKKLFSIGGNESTSSDNHKNFFSPGYKSPAPVIKVKSDGSVRSPLSTRNMDTDSPRMIVQRKQTNKLGLIRRCSSTPGHYQIFDDKENMHL